MRPAIRAILLGGVDPDARAWAAAVAAAGGEVSSERVRRTSNLIKGLKACGAWALRDDYAWFPVDNSTQATITLKKRLTQVAQNSPTFVANRGWLGSTTAYIDTQWNPLTNVTSFTRNNAAYSVYCYSAPSAGSYAMGGFDSIYQQITLGAATNTSYGVNSGVGPDTYAHGGVHTGWHTAERTAAGALAAYRDGVQKGTGTTASVAVDSVKFFIMADNGSTGAGTRVGGNNNGGFSAAAIGAALSSATLHAAEYAVIRAALTVEGVP